MIKRSIFKSPIGCILISADDDAIVGLDFVDGKTTICRDESDILLLAHLWLEEYFKGRIPGFTPALKLEGTEFRKKVWNYLLKIPYGRVVTYSHIAGELNSSARAVGGAVGSNPISLIVPCHRVIGADGSLTGFAWGLERKEYLLKLERSNI